MIFPQPKPETFRSVVYRAWIARQLCIIGGWRCWSVTQAAHVPNGTAGMATKGSDEFLMPLCAVHHAEQHANGWRTFAACHQIDPLDIARNLRATYLAGKGRT